MERVVAELRAQAMSRRGYVRCCHGRDTVPRAWTTLFRYLKAAYRKGLVPDHARDLDGCPCRNSDGYDAVMKVAYESGMPPKYEYIKGLVSPNGLVAAYNHGLRPCRAHFAAFDDDRFVLPVLAAAYAAGYRPDTDRDFYDRDWDDEQTLRAWTDAVRHGAAIDIATIHELGDYTLLQAAYERGGIVADPSHVATILEHVESALPHAYRAGLKFDFYAQIAMLSDDGVAADALVAAYSRGAHPESFHTEFVRTPEVLAAATRQLRREYAVITVFGADIGQAINAKSG